MLDNHYVPEGYGIISNFNIFGITISSYTLFVGLGCLIAILFYFLTMEKQEETAKKHTYLIVMSALIGGLIGSKIPVIIENIGVLMQDPSSIKYFLVTGKSIIGGLIGGFVSIKMVKKIKGISKIRYGNQIAPPAALRNGNRKNRLLLYRVLLWNCHK